MNEERKYKLLLVCLLTLLLSCGKSNERWTKTECVDNTCKVIYKSGDFKMNLEYWCSNNVLKYIDRSYKGKTLLTMFFYRNGKLRSVQYYNYFNGSVNSDLSFLEDGSIDTTRITFIQSNYNAKNRSLDLTLLTEYPYDSVVARKYPGSAPKTSNFDSVYFSSESFRAARSEQLSIPFKNADFLKDSLTIHLFNYTTIYDSTIRYEVMPYFIQFRNGEQYNKTTNLGVIR